MSDLPKDFTDRIVAFYGQHLAKEILSTFVPRPTSFRVNTITTSRDEVLQAIKEAGFEVKPVSWLQDAFTLLNQTKRALAEHALTKKGKIYIQSLASMVPPIVLDPKPGEKVLDLTAAPGSKTSQIAAMMHRQGGLVANDNNKNRFFKLKRNLENCGALSLNDGFLTLRLEHGVKLSREFPEYFDKVLLDAPCSAESRFISGDQSTLGYWKVKKVREIAQRQRPLLLAALRALKPGGILVYSTCTISPEENEAQVSWLKDLSSDRRQARIQNQASDFIEIEAVAPHLKGLNSLPPITSWKGKEFSEEVSKTFRIKPSLEIESFFVARIRKLGTFSP